MKKISEKLISLLAGISRSTILKISFFATGIASTIWFLARVIPKPQRAAYPCMRAAAPFMSGFVVYLLSLAGAAGAFRRARLNFARAKYLYGAAFFFTAIVLSFITLNINNKDAVAASTAEWIIVPNKPVGTATGLFPGRVVWIHDPAVAKWDSSGGNWWDDKVVSQTESDRMLSSSLKELTAEKSDKKAWGSVFRYYNGKHKGKASGYASGQKIAVKINTNNTYSHSDSPEINATPQLVLSLIKSLVNEAGVAQGDITVFDASRHITDNIFNKCHSAFPNVIFVDNIGGDGRIKATYAENAIPYSVDNGKLATGLATCAVDADYLINMALLKGHVGQGVTLCAKNYYGVTSIDKNWRNNAHNGFNQDRNGKATYLTFVDFMAHRDLGGKTVLYLIDGIYGSKLVNGAPGPKWHMAPFNNNWGCTLLASQDPVAIDAVGIDLLRTEWPDAPDMAFCDQYLIEAALAGNPPSGTKYDPLRRNEKIGSLGVMEHWNNPSEMKYSRNLGKNEGIELIRKSL